MSDIRGTLDDRANPQGARATPVPERPTSIRAPLACLPHRFGQASSRAHSCTVASRGQRAAGTTSPADSFTAAGIDHSAVPPRRNQPLGNPPLSLGAKEDSPALYETPRYSVRPD